MHFPDACLRWGTSTRIGHTCLVSKTKSRSCLTRMNRMRGERDPAPRRGCLLLRLDPSIPLDPDACRRKGFVHWRWRLQAAHGSDCSRSLHCPLGLVRRPHARWSLRELRLHRPGAGSQHGTASRVCLARSRAASVSFERSRSRPRELHSGELHAGSDRSGLRALYPVGDAVYGSRGDEACLGLVSLQNALAHSGRVAGGRLLVSAPEQRETKNGRWRVSWRLPAWLWGVVVGKVRPACVPDCVYDRDRAHERESDQNDSE